MTKCTPDAVERLPSFHLGRVARWPWIQRAAASASGWSISSRRRLTLRRQLYRHLGGDHDYDRQHSPCPHRLIRCFHPISPKNPLRERVTNSCLGERQDVLAILQTLGKLDRRTSGTDILNA